MQHHNAGTSISRGHRNRCERTAIREARNVEIVRKRKYFRFRQGRMFACSITIHVPWPGSASSLEYTPQPRRVQLLVWSLYAASDALDKFPFAWLASTLLGRRTFDSCRGCRVDHHRREKRVRGKPPSYGEVEPKTGN